MKVWYEANKDSLSRAERIFIESSENNLAVIEALLDRIVGKTLKFDELVIARDPILERFYSMSPDAQEAEIDQLIRNREIIKRENESIKTGIV